MQKVDKKFLKVILGNIVDVMNREKEYLLELDSAMGDGDLGLTMTTGFKTVYDEIDNIETDDLGSILMKLGMKMNAAVSSTMGTLISICFLKSAGEVKGKIEIELGDIANMGKAAVKGVMERGKAKVGDKTMLDALYPAIEAIVTAAEENNTLKESFDKAYKAAQAGVERTKELKSVHGRAAYYGDKSLGRPDSGAVAIMFIFEGIKQSF